MLSTALFAQICHVNLFRPTSIQVYRIQVSIQVASALRLRLAAAQVGKGGGAGHVAGSHNIHIRFAGHHHYLSS